MIKGVEMIYSAADNFMDYTYSYIDNKGQMLVYCTHCKKFEKMNVLVEIKVTNDRYNDAIGFEEHVHDKVFTYEKHNRKTLNYNNNKPKKVYKTNLKYMTYDRYFGAVTNRGDDPFRVSKVRRKDKKRFVNRQAIVFICPECNSAYKRHNILHFETRQNEAHRQCYGVEVFKEEGKNGTCIKISLLFLEYGIWNGNLVTSRYRKKITLNTGTGHAYRIKDLCINSKKKGSKRLNKIPIKNITYNDGWEVTNFIDREKWFIRDAYEAMYKAVYTEKVKQLNHKPDGYSEALSKELKTSHSMKHIIALNRFPNIEPAVLTSIIKSCGDDNIYVMNKRIYKIGMLNDSWINDVITIYNLPNTKFIKKLIRKGSHPDQIELLYNNVKEPNNILKLVDRFNRYYRTDFECELYKDMCKLYGETATVNKLVTESSIEWHYRDAINMYETAKRVLGRYDLKGTIREIHDNLSRDYRKLQQANIPLEYTEKEKVLELSSDDYDLIFAKDTHELIDVGTEMHICVGSYGTRALQKSCNIIVLRDKQRKPKVCIELSGDCRKIKQAKYYRNSRMPKQEFDFVTNWAKENKLIIETYDLDAPAQELKKVPYNNDDVNAVAFAF